MEVPVRSKRSEEHPRHSLQVRRKRRYELARYRIDTGEPKLLPEMGTGRTLSRKAAFLHGCMRMILKLLGIGLLIAVVDGAKV